MGFVQAGFLAALTAIAVPIIIHLVFDRRARRVDLGTLRFLQIVLRENVRRRRIKRWLLLAMRLACFALLAFLFARPYLATHELRGGDRLVVILVDRSASMGLETDRGRLIDLAIGEAKGVIRSCGEGTELHVAYFDHAVHPVGASTDADSEHSSAVRDDLIAGLDSPEIVYSSTDYGAALAWAHDLLAASRRARKELYLMTDLQRSGLDRTPAEPLPKDVQVHLVDLGQTFADNVAVTRVTPQKPSIRPGEPVTVDATVLNASPFSVEGVPVVLRLNNGDREQVLRGAADLDDGASATVRFELTDLAQGLWQGRVELEKDDTLPFDNHRFVALNVAPPLEVMLVDGDPRDSPLAAETHFLRTALRLATPDEVFVDSPFEPKVISLGQDDRLPNPDDTDLIVLANLAGLKSADARRIADFVKAGGGLLVFTGSNVTAERYGPAAAAGLTVGQILGEARATSLPWRLETWEEEHPVFRRFRDPQHGDLRRLAFRSYTKVQPAEGARVLARFRGGGPALVERRLGLGRVLWFTSTCDRDWGDWPRSRLYVPLIHQMLRYLAGLTDGGPVRTELIDEVETSGDDPLPGVFDKGTYHQVVNINPRESEMERCTPNELAARFQFELDLGREDRGDEAEAQLASAVDFRPDEIWHWVLLCLLAVLFGECFLANRTTA